MAKPLDLTETIQVLEGMVGSRVRFSVQVMPDENLDVLMISGVLGVYRVGEHVEVSGAASGYHAFIINPGPSGLSTEILSLHARQFLAGFPGNDNRIVTILLGQIVDGQPQVRAKLVVAQE